jgi:hypothetical protein
MIGLHNWLPSLMESFTFYKGGGKGGGGGKSSTNTGIDPMLKPYVNYGLSEAQKLYQTDSPQYYPGQTYVGPSEQTQTALQAAQNRALAGNPMLPQAQQQQQNVIGGQYLQNNPYFTQAMQGAADAAQKQFFNGVNQANSNASSLGRYGSGAHEQMLGNAVDSFGNTLANKYAETAYNNYSAERGRQEAAATNAPAMANADYFDINQLSNVGQTMEGYQKTALQSDIDRFNFEQNAPYAKLSTYLSSVYGAPSGSVSETKQSSSGGGKIICTAMNACYGFGSFRQAIWLKHSENLDPAYEKGYHRLFLPLVYFAYSKERSWARDTLKCVLEHVARHRTADIWKQRKGKRDKLGMIYRAIVEPICFVAGKV